MTHPSKSKTRSVVAIGYGCVIPAEAGIQRRLKRTALSAKRTGLATNATGFPLARERRRGYVIPAEAGIQRRSKRTGLSTKRSGLFTNATGFPLARERRPGCVIPAEAGIQRRSRRSDSLVDATVLPISRRRRRGCDRSVPDSSTRGQGAAGIQHRSNVCDKSSNAAGMLSRERRQPPFLANARPSPAR